MKALVFAIDENEYIPAEIMAGTFRKYTLPLLQKTKNILSPLTYDQQRSCPEFERTIGVSSDNAEFVSRVTDFWSDWSFEIPISKFIDGIAISAITIDGGFTTTEDKKIVPNNINEFILYNALKQDVNVGKSKESYEIGLTMYDYHMIDLSQKKADDAKNLDLEEAIYIVLSKISTKSDEDKSRIYRAILQVSGKFDYYTLNSLTETDLKRDFFTFAKNNGTTFISLMKDKDLELKALIGEMINKNVINQLPSGDVYINDEKIGGVENVVLWFKEGANLAKVKILKDTLIGKKFIDVVAN
jgi:hypothetical protein